MTEACVNVDILVGLLQQLENKPSGALLKVFLYCAVKKGSESGLLENGREGSSQRCSLLGDAAHRLQVSAHPPAMLALLSVCNPAFNPTTGIEQTNENQ